MMQLKAIFRVLLLDWEFEPAQPPDTYRNDHSKMVVQLSSPASCATAAGPGHGTGPGQDRPADAHCRRHRPLPGPRRLRVRGPGVFELGKDHQVVVLDASPDAASRPAVEAAVRFCPTHALSLVDEGVARAVVPPQ